MGDGRTYEYVVALRAVQTSDFMTADWAQLPYELLARVSSRIINEVRGINRVAYDISSKPNNPNCRASNSTSPRGPYLALLAKSPHRPMPSFMGKNDPLYLVSLGANRIGTEHSLPRGRYLNIQISSLSCSENSRA